jgi:tetratricopeptide (TPR) repeat protein
MPWFRYYTLNVDDMESAVQAAYALPRRVSAVSALTAPLPAFGADLLAVHLNGIVGDCPQITFSHRQYGERTAHPDPWYQHLVSDLASHPILFVGTELDEPPLFQQIEMRRAKERRVRELRPGSYLVTPSMSVARKAMLEDFNVQLVEMTQEQFATEVLAALEVERRQGLAAITTRYSSPAPRLLQRVAELRSEADDGSSEFLLGREPRWSDITSGRAVKRRFEDDLATQIRDRDARVAILTGTAGAGRSSTLMRLALRYDAEGKQVFWLSSQTDQLIHAIRVTVGDAKPDVVMIDDADNFGTNTGRLLAQLSTNFPDVLVVASMRTTKYNRLEIDQWLSSVEFLTYAVPHLEDDDIQLLIDALTTAGRLGALRGKTRREQADVFKQKAGRQLLVAMIEATSNERFEEKIERECRELSTESAFVYATVALATSLRTYLTKEEMLLASGEASNETLTIIDQLVVQRLLTFQRGNEIRLRHRVIAEHAVDYYKAQGLLREPLIGLVWTMATKAHPDLPRHSREHKLLRTMMNHSFMMNLTDDRDTPRKAYDLIEDLQSANYHYYLQRGSYEVEIGDLDLAKNLLEQARNLAPTDYMVQTAWAYMTLKRAAMNAASVGASDQAREAFAELEDAIARRGKGDPYPYHVLGSQGLSWVRRAVLSSDEKGTLLGRLLQIVKEGMRYHPRQRELAQLFEDLEREYLSLAVR